MMGLMAGWRSRETNVIGTVAAVADSALGEMLRQQPPLDLLDESVGPTRMAGVEKHHQGHVGVEARGEVGMGDEGMGAEGEEGARRKRGERRARWRQAVKAHRDLEQGWGLGSCPRSRSLLLSGDGDYGLVRAIGH